MSGTDTDKGIYSPSGLSTSIALKTQQPPPGNRKGVPPGLQHGLSQLTKRRIRMFITMPSAKKVNMMDDPP